MNTENVGEVLKAFALSPRDIHQPRDAKLASVYILDGLHVLRSREFREDTCERFSAERERLRTVAERTGYSFPRYLAAANKKHYVIDRGCFWTLHRLIRGRTLGNWYELHRVLSPVDRQVLTALRRLHERTRGCFDEGKVSRAFLTDRIRPLLEEAGSFLTAESRRRIHGSFLRVKSFSETYSAAESCFVHGDFHHGNIIANKGRVVGFIDLDWCRVGHPAEDLGYTMMMLLRDYASWSAAFRRKRYEDLLSLYRYHGDRSILNDQIVLYALFDCGVFKNADFERAEYFHAYQKMFLETVCMELATPPE
jgi:thiamine kinase-like enzyme